MNETRYSEAFGVRLLSSSRASFLKQTLSLIEAGQVRSAHISQCSISENDKSVSENGRGKRAAVPRNLCMSYPNPAYERAKKPGYLKRKLTHCVKCLKPLGKPMFICEKDHACCHSCHDVRAPCVICFRPLMGDYDIGVVSRSPKEIRKIINHKKSAQKRAQVSREQTHKHQQTKQARISNYHPLTNNDITEINKPVQDFPTTTSSEKEIQGIENETHNSEAVEIADVSFQGQILSLRGGHKVGSGQISNFSNAKHTSDYMSSSSSKQSASGYSEFEDFADKLRTRGLHVDKYPNEFEQSKNLLNIYTFDWIDLTPQTYNQVVAHLASKMMEIVHRIHKSHLIHGSLKLENFRVSCYGQNLRMFLTDIEKAVDVKRKVKFTFPHYIHSNFYPEKWTVELWGYRVDYVCLAKSIGGMLSSKMLEIFDHYGQSKICRDQFSSVFQTKGEIWAYVLEELLNARPPDLLELSEILQERLGKIKEESVIRFLQHRA